MEPDYAQLSTAALEETLKAQPTPLKYSSLAQRHMAEKKPNTALRTAEEGVKAFPESSLVHNAAGILYAEAGRVEDARRSFGRAIVLNKKHVDGYLNLGQLGMVTEDFALALAEFDRATTVDPKSANAWMGVGEAAARLRYAGQAREAFLEAVKLAPDNPMTHAALGTFLAEQEGGKDAQNYLERAEQLGLRSGKLYASLAMVYADQPDSPAALEKAIKAADEAKKLGNDGSLTNYARGLAEQRLGRYEAALKTYQKVVRQSVTSNGAWVGMSQCYRALGKRKEANAAAMMGEKILNERQRVANMQHQIRANPSRLEYRERYAKELMARQNYLMAADQYRYIAQHRPDQPKEWLRVAEAMEKGGKADIARYLRDYVSGALKGSAPPGGPMLSSAP